MNAEEARLEVLRRKDAAEHLLPFAAYTMGERWKTGPHHVQLADKLEAVERGDIKRLIVTEPPRFGKTELVTRRFIAWFLGRHPDRSVILACYGDSLAEEFGRDCRLIIESELYQNVFATRLREDVRSAGRWQTTVGGKFFAAGVGSGITGRGADLIVMDDVVKSRAEADSEATRRATWDWFTSTLWTRREPNAGCVFCCTRWHEDDLAGMLLAHDEQWELLSMPALDEDDNSLWPERFSSQELTATRDQIGTRDWQSLYMQNPIVETGTYFQRAWFDDHRYDIPPENLSIYCSTDFAVTKNGGDFTELCIFGEDRSSDIYILEWHYAQTTLDKSIDTLLSMCKRHRPRTIFGESGVIKSSLEPFLQKRMREEGQWTQCEWITRRSDKQASAQPIRARASMGKVRFPKKPWADRVINQCCSFPAGKYDDAVDTLALIGMALDKTHAPASTYRRPPPRRGTTWMSR